MSQLPIALVLESPEDWRAESLNSQREFMRLLGSTYDGEASGCKVITREVHTREDFKYFLDKAIADPDIELIHFVGHGSATGVEFTVDELDFDRTADLNLFRNLRNKILLFSCCDLGGKQQVLDKIQKTSGAWAVFGYASKVHDYQAFLIDAMLYHLLFGPGTVQSSDRDLGSILQRLTEAIHQLWLYRRGQGLGDAVIMCSPIPSGVNNTLQSHLVM